MAFRNAKNILNSCSPLNSYKLLLASALSSRPQLSGLWMALLRPFIRHGQLGFEYRCYGKTVKASLRMAELASDIQVVWELCVRDTYAIDPNFAPDLVVDGGGNIGLFSLRIATLARSVNGAPVELVIVEPVAYNIETLQSNLQANAIPAQIKQACLGGTRRTMPFYRREATQSSFDAKEPYTEVIDIPVICIQDAIGSSSAERILIKLDIEGMELEALRAFIPSERRGVYILGELHDVAGEGPLLEALCHQHGWSWELYEVFDNHCHFRAYSPAALAHAGAAHHLLAPRTR